MVAWLKQPPYVWGSEERHQRAKRVSIVALALGAYAVASALIGGYWLPGLEDYGVPFWHQAVVIAPVFAIGLTYGLLYHHHVMVEDDKAAKQ